MDYRPQVYTPAQKRLHHRLLTQHLRPTTARINHLLRRHRRRLKLAWYIIAAGIALAATLFFATAQSAASEDTPEPITVVTPAPATLHLPDVPDKPRPAIVKRLTTKRVDYGTRALSDHYAAKYGVKGDFMWAIVMCESGGNPNAKNSHSSATGIAQILLSAHPNITREQALDPDFSLDWMANKLGHGGSSHWAQCL